MPLNSLGKLMADDKQLRLRILFGQEIAMGPGKLNLLRAISTRGSISGAARQMNMSYRRAWLLVDTMNRCFRSPVVAASPGGKGGGGRPDFAQAGGTEINKIDEAIKKLKSLI